MSEQTNTPTVPTAPTAPAPTPDVIKTSLDIAGSPFNWSIHSRKVKGKEEEKEVCIPDVPTDTLAFVLAVAKMVGIPNFVGALNREVFRPAAYSASEDGFKDGRFNGVKFLEAFKAEFDPRQAKSRGPKKAEIIEARAKFTEELTELIVKATSGNWSEADKNRFMVIKVELAKLGELQAKKDRRGKAPEAKAAPAPAAGTK